MTEPTQACVDAVMQASPVLRWLNDPGSLAFLLAILAVEVVLHIAALLRVTLALMDVSVAMGRWLWSLHARAKYWALPADGKVLHAWYGSAWWAGRARIHVLNGRQTRKEPHASKDRREVPAQVDGNRALDHVSE